MGGRLLKDFARAWQGASFSRRAGLFFRCVSVAGVLAAYWAQRSSHNYQLESIALPLPLSKPHSDPQTAKNPANNATTATSTATTTTTATTATSTAVTKKLPQIEVSQNTGILEPKTSQDKALKILHLSDFHFYSTGGGPNGLSRILGKGREDLVEWVASLSKLDFDFTVLSGDNLALACGLPMLRQSLEPLLSRGGFFVFGAHDYYQTVMGNPLVYLWQSTSKTHMDLNAKKHIRRLPANDVKNWLLEAGWQDLNNAKGKINIERGGINWKILAAGVDDPHIKRDEFPTNPWEHKDADASEENTTKPFTTHTLRLGVTHAPYRRILDSFANHGADLVLAGHTHGGQVCLPGGLPLVTNCDLPPSFAKGLFVWPPALKEQSELFATGTTTPTFVCVSSGLGTSPFSPWRVACPPLAQLISIFPHDRFED